MVGWLVGLGWWVSDWVDGWVGWWVSGWVDGWVLASTTNSNIYLPNTNTNFLSCSGLYRCNGNNNNNNGTISLSIYLDGSISGYTTINNGYFYAVRIA